MKNKHIYIAENVQPKITKNSNILNVLHKKYDGHLISIRCHLQFQYFSIYNYD